MAENLVNYESLEQAASVYASQAMALDDLINRLISTNGELQSGWKNQTSEAFINRFETDHKVKLQQVRDELQEISDYIRNYVANRQEEDDQGARAIFG